MENRKNDMFAIMLNQPEATFEDMVMHGVTAGNTGLKDRDYYKGIEDVKNNDLFKDENGKFSDVKFNNFYDSVLKTYNTFSNEDYEKKVLENLAKDPLDWTQPFKTNVKDVSAVIYSGGGDYARRAKSITGIGSIGNAIFSMREIAQDNEARDENGNLLGWTPNNHGLFKSIFAPTMVLATYDENGFHDENGKQVEHFAGQYKLDENGDPYYEKLGNRDSYGKEVLRFTDTITVDGSPINKWDFLDSDGIDKSIGKTVLQTAAFVAPLLIPGMAEVWGTLGMVGGLMGAMPTLLKGVNGIIGNNDSPYGRALTQAESWMQRWAPTQSDASKGKFMTFENLGEIVRTSAMQLFSQRQVANLSRHLLNGGDLMANSKVGQALSLGYMALTSSTDTYSAFKEAGASDAAAGIGMLATIGALYELMNIDYFKDALFKGTWLDESEVNNVLKNYSKDNVTRLLEAETGKSIDKINNPATKKEAANLFNTIKNGLKDGWDKFAKSSLSGAPKDLTLAVGLTENGAKTGVRKALSTFNVILNRSMNEGIEETMEEVAQDAVKALFAGCDALGINVKADNVEDLSFGWSLSEAMERYLTSFGGGFLGGAVFEGITQYENKIYKRPSISDFNNTSEQMLFLVLTGHGKEIKDRAKLYRDKGMLGDKNLSVKRFTEGENGNIFFGAADGADNQNDFAYNLICHEVDRLEKITADAGITVGAVQRYLTEFGENIDSIGNLDTVVSAAIKKLGMHTTFMDDLVKLSEDIVEVESQIQALTPSANTDSGQRALEREGSEESSELKRLKKLKADLLKKRDAFFNHENDREYIEQAIYLANAPLQRAMLNIVANPEEGISGATYDPETDAFKRDQEGVENGGFANYMWLRYKERLTDLGEEEKKYYQKEYEDFIEEPGNISNIQNVGKVLFQMYRTINQTMAPKLMEAEELLKDTVANPLYEHKAQYMSQEYKDYIKSLNGIEETKRQMQILQEQLSTLEPDSTEFNRATIGLSQQTRLNELYTQVVEDYELLHDGNKSIFTETPTEEGLQFQGKLVDRMVEIRDLQDGLKQNKLNPDQKLEVRLAIQSQFGEILNDVKSYFETLKANNIISGPQGDLLIGKVLNFAAEVLDNIDSEWVDLSSGASIIDTVTSNEFATNESLIPYLLTIKEALIDTLKSGNINDVMSVFKKLTDDLSFNGDGGFIEWSKNENGEQVPMTDEEIKVEVSKIVDGIQKLIFGNSITDFITGINESRKTTKTYGLANLLEDFGIAVGEDIRPLLELIDEQKKSLLSEKDLENFALSAGSKNALQRVRSLLRFAVVAIQSAYDGTNKNINALPKGDKDIPLAEISENTKNRLLEDLDYLNDIVNTLLIINAKNEFTKKGYAQKSEVWFHQSLMSELLNGTPENEATWVGKFNTIFGVNLPDLWNKAGVETDSTVSFDSLTADNFGEFKKRYIKFFQLLREEILLGKEGEDGKKITRTLKDIGIGLGQMLDKKARLNRYGEINAGEYDNDSKNKLTNLGTVVVLGALLNEDYGEWYQEFVNAQNEEDYPYTPFMQQEVAVHISYEFINSDSEDSLFSQIAQAIDASELELSDDVKDKESKQNSWNALKTLENLFFVQGGTGSGKTTATSFLTYKMLQNRAKKLGKKTEVVVAAPTEKQLTPYASLLGIDKEHAFIQADVLKKIGGNVDGAFIYNADLSDSEDEKVKEYFATQKNTSLKDSVIPDGDIKELFKEDDSEKYIFIDEAQFLNGGSLELLNKWAKDNGVKVLLYGDIYQNGATFKKGESFIENNITDVIVLSCPSLGESIRFENSAKERNYKSLKACIEEMQDLIDKNFTRDADEIKDLAKQVVEKRTESNIPVTLQYYEEGDTFVGEHVVGKDDVSKYLEKFKKLSSELHEDNKQDVCIIVETPEDKQKYFSSEVDVKTVEEVLTAKEVQGKEYDFVIIDKPFDSDNFYSGYKDLYTLIGRSKIGSIIVGDLTDLQIKDEKGPVGLTTKTNDKQSFDEYSSWKTGIYDQVGITPKEPVEAKEEKPKGKPEPISTEDDETIDPATLRGDEGVLAVHSIPVKATLEVKSNEEGVPEKVDDSRPTLDFVEAVRSKRRRLIEEIRSSDTDPSAAFDWNEYVAWAENPNGLLANEGIRNGAKKSTNRFSLTSELSGISGETTQKNLITFFRRFASGIVYNMKFQQHHLSSLKSLFGVSDRTKIETLCTNWNSEKKHTFVAASDDVSNKSIIYWQTTLNDKTKLIPIAIVEGKVNGTTTVSSGTNIFQKVEEFWGIKGDASQSSVDIDKRLTSVGTVSKAKVLSIDEKEYKGDKVGNPGDSFETNGDDTVRFFKDNSGHAFSLVTDCELLQKEDFDAIFTVKKKGSQIVYAFNADSASSEQLPDGFKSEDLENHQRNLVMQVSINGTVVPVMSLNVHKYVSLSTLYNLANIGRFAAQQISFEALTKEQQKLIGGNDRQKAMSYVSSYLGEFDVLATDTHLVKENQRNIAANKRMLNYNYRLLTPKASFTFMGAMFDALSAIDKESDTSYTNLFYDEVLKILATPTYHAERSNIHYKNGLKIQIPTKKGFKYFFVSIEKDGNSYAIRTEPIEVVGREFRIKNNDSDHIKVRNSKIEDVKVEDVIKDCIGLCENTEISDIFDELGKGRIQIGLMQRLTREGKVYLNMNDDYNAVTTLLNCLPISKNPALLDQLEAKMKLRGEFKDGFTLNENRQINDTLEESRKQTKWATLRSTRQKLVRSNLQSIEGRIWKLMSVNGAPLFNGTDSGFNISFKYNSDDVQTEAFTFESKKSSWDGNTLNCDANVDALWLTTFTVEKSFTTKAGKPVTKAKINSINFDTGEIVLTIGTSKVKATLTKNETNKYPSVSELSNNTILDREIFTQNNVNYTVKGGKLFSDNVELRPLFKLNNINYFASVDGNLQIMLSSADMKTLGVVAVLPSVVQIAPNLYIDNKTKSFYSNAIRLGKLLDYSENFIIFENGKLEYEQVPEKYIPENIKELHSQSEVVPPTQKQFRSFGEKAKYQVSQNPFILKAGSEYIFLNKSWIVNGAWLYNNSDYDGGDGTFVITSMTADGTIKTSSGNTYKLNKISDAPIDKASVDAQKDYLKYILGKERLLDSNLESIIDNSVSYEETIDSLNAALVSKGIRLYNNLEINTISIIEEDPAELSMKNYASRNGIEISGELRKTGFNSEISILEGKKGDSNVGIYSVMNKNLQYITFESIPFSELISLISNIEKFADIPNAEFKTLIGQLLNNPFDEGAVDALDNFMLMSDFAENISDDDYKAWSSQIKPLLESLQKTIKDAKENNLKCDF